MSGLEVTQIDHLSVVISDVERSRRFYRDVLGLKEIAKPRTFDFVVVWFDLGNQQLHLLLKERLFSFMREDARILLLDEPTSALDAQAEYDLFERLRSLTHGRTAVYISHRFSTVRRADRIVFLEHGRLVEEGTHEELMRLNGRYARLFRMQAAAYTGEDVEELVGDVG